MTVLTELKDDVFNIKLNRPEKSNSYDRQMAEEIRDAFLGAQLSEAKLVLLTSAGEQFCAGADLSWMSEENADMSIIKEMYEAVLALEIPLIGLVQGATRGGGMGLVACCDIVFCEPSANFSLSEAKWGLIPGIITPIVIQKIGPSQFLELAISARIFHYEEALAMHLVHHPAQNLEEMLKQIKQHSLNSTKMIKKIVREDFLSYQSLYKMLKFSNEMRSSADFKSRIKSFIDS